MKKILAVLINISILVQSLPLYADDAVKPGMSALVEEVAPEVPKAEKDLGAALSPLKKLQIAPFTGVLLSPLAVANLIAELNAKSEEIKIEVDKAKDDAKVKFEYEKTILQNSCIADKKVIEANLINQQKQVALLDAALRAEIESRPSPAGWAILGLAAGVIVATATASVIVAAGN
jgi:hypothetical protein